MRNSADKIQDKGKDKVKTKMKIKIKIKTKIIAKMKSDEDRKETSLPFGCSRYPGEKY